LRPSTGRRHAESEPSAAGLNDRRRPVSASHSLRVPPGGATRHTRPKPDRDRRRRCGDPEEERCWRTPSALAPARRAPRPLLRARPESPRVSVLPPKRATCFAIPFDGDPPRPRRPLRRPGPPSCPSAPMPRASAAPRATRGPTTRRYKAEASFEAFFLLRRAEKRCDFEGNGLGVRRAGRRDAGGLSQVPHRLPTSCPASRPSRPRPPFAPDLPVVVLSPRRCPWIAVYGPRRARWGRRRGFSRSPRAIATGPRDPDAVTAVRALAPGERLAN